MANSKKGSGEVARAKRWRSARVGGSVRRGGSGEPLREAESERERERGSGGFHTFSRSLRTRSRWQKGSGGTDQAMAALTRVSVAAGSREAAVLGFGDGAARHLGAPFYRAQGLRSMPKSRRLGMRRWNSFPAESASFTARGRRRD